MKNLLWYTILMLFPLVATAQPSATTDDLRAFLSNSRLTQANLAPDSSGWAIFLLQDSVMATVLFNTDGVGSSYVIEGPESASVEFSGMGRVDLPIEVLAWIRGNPEDTQTVVTFFQTYTAIRQQYGN